MDQPINKDRIVWINVARGIAILLMVLGHSAIPLFLNRFIFAFHMPFFFIASGYTTNFTRDSHVMYVLKKAKGLLIPFVIYSAINLVLQNYVSELSLVDYCIRFLKYGWMGVPLWFVPVLFLSLILSRLIISINKLSLVIFGGCVVMIVSVLLSIEHVKLPWNMSVTPYASFFIITGYLVAHFYKGRIELSSKIILWAIGLVSLLITMVISYYWRLDMCSNRILPVVPITIAAIAGTLFISILSIGITKYLRVLTKCLQKIGNETFLILAFAEILIVYINHFYDFNSIVKYLILAIALVILYFVKEGFVKLYKQLLY